MCDASTNQLREMIKYWRINDIVGDKSNEIIIKQGIFQGVALNALRF